MISNTFKLAKFEKIYQADFFQGNDLKEEMQFFNTKVGEKYKCID